MMRVLAISILLVVASSASAQPLERAGDLQRLPLATIADALLPPDHPPIAHIVFDDSWLGFVPVSYDQISLLTAAVPIGEDFCSQQGVAVRTTPIPRNPDAPLTVMPKPLGERWRGALFRYRPLGAQCSNKGISFVIYGIPVERGLAVVRALAGAVRVARSTKSVRRLPFMLSCRGPYGVCNRLDEVMSLYIGMLTSLQPANLDDLERYGAIGRVASRQGGELYEIRIDSGAPMQVLSAVVLIRAGRVRAIHLSRAEVVY